MRNPFDVQAASVELQPTGLTLRSGPDEAYFNAYWLRDNCASSFDPQTQERIFDIRTWGAAGGVGRGHRR